MGAPSHEVPKSGWSLVVEPMLLTQAADRLCTGYPLMSVFHALSAGKVGHGALEAAVVVVDGAVVVVVEGRVVVVEAVVVVVGFVVVVVGRVVVVLGFGFAAVVVVPPVGSHAAINTIASTRRPSRRMSNDRHRTPRP
ncbi:MAG: hypothetical protein ACJ739_13175 [Acidimicrobiales bacterium]